MEKTTLQPKATLFFKNIKLKGLIFNQKWMANTPLNSNFST